MLIPIHSNESPNFTLYFPKAINKEMKTEGGWV